MRVIDPYTFQVWENEGGRVYDCLDDDWEPSESEVFTVSDSAIPGARYTFEDQMYRLTCMFAEAVRHVRKYFFNRVDVATEPTIAQQVGEFVTEIRRLRAEYSFLTDFKHLTDTDAWASVCVPSSRNDHKWRFSFHVSGGLQHMTLPLAQTICENALKMATTDKTIDEDFREINNTLNNLLREQTALDTLIYKAKDLNAQAVAVVDNLCCIAEKLQE
jgi:hypothetical protein